MKPAPPAAPRTRADRRRRTARIAAAALVAIVSILGTYPVWKPAAKRYKWFVVATNTYQDLVRRVHLSTDQIGNPYTTVPDESALPEHLARIDELYTGYLHHAGFSPADIRGRTVLEIGPGDNVGVALRFVAAGASRVIAIDKFVPFQTSAFHQKLYRQLRDRLPPEEQARVDSAIDLTNGVWLKPGGPLGYIYGHGIEDVSDQVGSRSVDIIVSNAVMEEVYRADAAWDALDRIWRPGGYQIHKIDLGDYGMFTKHGFHPLEYLTIPDPVYRYMSESVGAPNRRLIDYYRSKMAAFGYDATIYATWILGEAEELRPPRVSTHLDDSARSQAAALIRAIRPRLLERYRQLSDEDLMVRGILLVARAPAPPTLSTSQ